jgi:hypothetical protein
VLHLTDDVDVPTLLVARLELHALEGNADLDLVAVLGERPFDVNTNPDSNPERRGRKAWAPSAGGQLPGLDDRAIHLTPKGLTPNTKAWRWS